MFLNFMAVVIIIVFNIVVLVINVFNMMNVDCNISFCFHMHSVTVCEGT